MNIRYKFLLVLCSYCSVLILCCVTIRQISFAVNKRELGVPRNTCVTAQAFSEKGNNSKCIESKSMTLSYAQHKQEWKRGITPKVLMYLKHDASSYHTLSMDETS